MVTSKAGRNVLIALAATASAWSLTRECAAGPIGFVFAQHEAQSEPTKQDLINAANALITAVKYAIPGDEFLTLASNANIGAIAGLKLHLRKLETDTTTAYNQLDPGEERNRLVARLRVIQDLWGKSQAAEAAAKGRHAKQGGDPWGATFIVEPNFQIPTVPGGTSSATATIDASQLRTATWIIPVAWNGGSVRQDPEGAISFSVTLLLSGDLQVTLDPVNLTLPSFPINIPGHAATGVNLTSFPSGSFLAKKERDGVYSFSFSMLGALTNNLASPSDPGIDMAKVSGLLFAGSNGEPARIEVGANDTLLVPGPTPLGQLPILYVASQSLFDPATGSIRFRNPFTDGSGLPVIAADTFAGTFASILNGAADPIFGANYFIDDLLISVDTGIDILFADSAFRIVRDSSILARGFFTNVRFNRVTGDFLGDTRNVELFGMSPLLLEFFTASHVYQFMAPIDALLLYELSTGFAISSFAPVIHPEITLINHNVTPSVPSAVPEPSTWLLLGVGLVAVAARARRMKCG
jgi:PEP-CTERM motif-containing protein